MSSTFEKEFGKGKSKITVPFNAWQVKAESIRKLNRARKEQVLDTEPVAAQPEEVPLYPFVFEKGLNLRPFRISVV